MRRELTLADYKKCTECGLCRNACPVFNVIKRETLSPRGKVLMLKDDIKDEIFWACSLCKNCVVACPLGLKLCPDFVKQRAKLEKEGKTTQSNRHLIENVRKYGNPIGKVEEGKIPKELFCC